MQTNGQLVSAVGGKCAGVGGDDPSKGGRVVLMDCDAAARDKGRTQWEMQGNGQWQLAGPGVPLCLSQQGVAPGTVNAACKTAASASSTASAFHGASLAVDGRPGTFWASKFDDVEHPVVFAVDLGQRMQVEDIVISWEFAPKAFAVATSLDGVHFTEIFATDVNIVSETRLRVATEAQALKVTMLEPHPTLGALGGHRLYGIRTFSVRAPAMVTVAEPCADAARTRDARDKYFAVSVRESSSDAGKRLAGELPAFEAAKSSLAAAASELSSVLAAMPACARKATAEFRNATAATRGSWEVASSARPGVPPMGPMGEALAEDLGLGAAGLLLGSAREVIRAARKELS